jgi:hypothetical protein
MSSEYDTITNESQVKNMDTASAPTKAPETGLNESPQPIEKSINPLTVTQSAQEHDDEINYLSLIFRDGLDMPIPNLELFITLPSGQICTAKSTDQGAITLPVQRTAIGQAKIEVNDPTGKRQSVCSIDLAQCTEATIVRSPKVKTDLELRPHQQELPKQAVTQKPSATTTKKKDQTLPEKIDTKSMWYASNGAAPNASSWINKYLHMDLLFSPKGLSKAGQPVTAIAGPECPNKDKLRLGRNNVYRTAILDAATRLGLIPQALCALMDCEAGKVTEHIPKLGPDGKQLKDKKDKLITTKVRELWNANAGNAQSGAAGLTQFLASTWLDHVLRPGLYIHTHSVANNWVCKATSKKSKKPWVFILSDKTTTDEPYKHRSDENVKKCLAMRMDATWSINAAADYGNMNLQILNDKGFKLKGLNDMDKAKLMYLLHHEGGGVGPLFINNKLVNRIDGQKGLAQTKAVFAIQLGSDGAALSKKLIDAADGDAEVAYRWWLAQYIDKNFDQAGKYFCSQPLIASKLSDLFTAIGGSEIEIVE